MLRKSTTGALLFLFGALSCAVGALVYVRHGHDQVDDAITGQMPCAPSVTQPSRPEPASSSGNRGVPEPIVEPPPSSPTTNATVPLRPPRAAFGLLWDAKRCLKDPYYNPDAKVLTAKQVRELQQLIDSMSRDLAELQLQKESAYKSLAEKKLAAGLVVTPQDLARRRNHERVLLDLERASGEGDSFRSQHVIVFSGDDPLIDQLVSDFDARLQADQRTVRDAIAAMH